MMIQISVHSTNNNVLVIPLPEQYRGKDIEVLKYPKDELEALQPKQTVTMADFVGTISNKNAQELRTHTEKTRTEWDRDF